MTTTVAGVTIARPLTPTAANTHRHTTVTAALTDIAATIANNLRRQKTATAATNADHLLNQNAMRNVGTSRGSASCVSTRRLQAHSHQESPSLGTTNGKSGGNANMPAYSTHGLPPFY